MKVYIQFNEVDGIPNPSHLVKVKLPLSWIDSGTVEQVIELFVDAYNKKFSDHPLASDKLTLISHQGQVIPPTGTIKACIKEYDELKVTLKAAMPATSVSAGASGPPGTLLCRNYGCAKRYLPSENGPESCLHHTAPPIFREIQKSWSCCPDKSAWDWEGFTALPT